MIGMFSLPPEIQSVVMAPFFVDRRPIFQHTVAPVIISCTECLSECFFNCARERSVCAYAECKARLVRTLILHNDTDCVGGGIRGHDERVHCQSVPLTIF